MATFGMGKADASLVAAGHRLGQSSIPGDHSKIFAKQYEGLLAASTAEMKMKASGQASLLKGVGEVAGKGAEIAKSYLDTSKEKKDQVAQAVLGGVDIESQLSEIGNDLTDAVITDNAQAYIENEASSEINVNPAQEHLERLAYDWGQLNKKGILRSKEEKTNQQELFKQIQQFRPTLVKAKAQKQEIMGSWISGGIDKIGSFKGEPNLQQLFTLTMDKGKTEAQLNEIGIKGIN